MKSITRWWIPSGTPALAFTAARLFFRHWSLEFCFESRLYQYECGYDRAVIGGERYGGRAGSRCATVGSRSLSSPAEMLLFGISFQFRIKISGNKLGGESLTFCGQHHIYLHLNTKLCDILNSHFFFLLRFQKNCQLTVSIFISLFLTPLYLARWHQAIALLRGSSPGCCHKVWRERKIVPLLKLKR